MGSVRSTEPTRWLWSGPAGYSTTRQHSCGVAKAGRHLLGQLGGARLDLAADLSVALGMDPSARILLCGIILSVCAVNRPSALSRPGRRYGVASGWLGSQPARNADQPVKLASGAISSQPGTTGDLPREVTMSRSLTTEPTVAIRAEVHGTIDCPIGEAIAILMARHDINYTRAFAGLIVSSERIQRSLPEIAAEVIRNRSVHGAGRIGPPSPQRPDAALLVQMAGLR